MMKPVSREAFADALVELLPRLDRGRPTELGLPRVDERAARYVAELRHGRDDGGVHLLARKNGRVTALAAVAPSPFDTSVFGTVVGRVQTLEVVDEAEAPSLVRAVERAARALDLELLFARVAPGSPMLAALIDRGFQAYGATVLYTGRPSIPPEPAECVVPVRERKDVAEAARIARAGFDDTHLSRDLKLDAQKVRMLYERWVKAEADRGAKLFMIRDGGRAVAVSVCRDNPLIRERLGIRQWHLHLLAVHPRWRGSGYGRLAAEAAFRAALDAGAEGLQTGVDTGSIAAQRIYTRSGLVPSNASLALHRWL